MFLAEGGPWCAWVLPPTSLSVHTSAYQTAAYGPHSCVKVLAYDRSSSIPHRQ
ncbi:hypothetical protein SCLCIDRAFT_1211202 [Scleroderma citrinum Foug A]|uniref:Uncharacterized protein n=1 Tax=Scleroderma citrinum Foug A TaxID=1036808 RepID=A0A0C3AN98_9AGAM|nr:hypothetical protein SCLCIDRAFT_1211202 [Scleroderma citrinum Foug A]